MADRPVPDLKPEELPADFQAVAQALFESRRFAVQLGIERQHLRDTIDGLRSAANEAARREVAAEVDALSHERDGARSERDVMRGERDAALGQRDAALVERDRARAMLERVTSSTAWRLTGPARRVLQTMLGR